MNTYLLELETLWQEQLAQLLPKNELVTDYMAPGDVREKHDALKAESVKLEAQIKQLQDSLDTLLRIQQRYDKYLPWKGKRKIIFIRLFFQKLGIVAV